MHRCSRCEIVPNDDPTHCGAHSVIIPELKKNVSARPLPEMFAEDETTDVIVSDGVYIQQR
jgi:hypothetical protein